jgi:hypothetical protein
MLNSPPGSPLVLLSHVGYSGLCQVHNCPQFVLFELFGVIGNADWRAGNLGDRLTQCLKPYWKARPVRYFITI